MENIFAGLDLKTILTIAGTIGGCYAAIRADIKTLYTRLTAVEKDVTRIDLNSSRAHQRIDDHITDFHARGNK